MTYQPTSNDNQDYALPSHFFDSEATQIAQPVTPLTAAVVSPKRESKPTRRSWMFGAIAVSALVGSLVTVAAFSFYQRRTANSTPNQQATAPAAVTAPTPGLAAFPSPSPEASPTNIAVSMDEIDEPSTSPSPESTASSRPTTAEARRTENANSNAANDAVKNAKDNSNNDAARRTTTAAVEKQPKKDESVAADKNAEREAEERRAAERATAERLAAERAAARREEAKRAADEENENERRPRKVGKRGDDANTEDEEPVAPPQRRYADRIRRVLGDERQPRERRNRQRGTSEGVSEIFEGQPPR
ncbi:MAG: hypothetical protein MSG64_03280 [Pyrinomonadaceae bacterium MAG19_C2-C3]|nr:hypothetical protein [Pyrinomonadaceae bacterium MAG19_C2-C3]